ncbi:DUF4113 domain-containing protein [Vibrio splendidus]
MYCLIDGSRFYCSSSTAMRPDLRDKCVLVASGLDGISIAASRACSEHNIPKFTPIFQVKDKLALFGGVVIKANFGMLGLLSQRMMQSIDHAMGVGLPHYVYSVDEVFYDLKDLHSVGVDLEAHLLAVRKRVYQETRIGTGGGIGRTLTLAKCGSFAGKKLPGYNGQCVLDTIRHENAVLKSMPTKEIWNIGAKLTEHLKHKGITNAYQLKLADPRAMQREFSINVANVVHELNGTPVLNFSDTAPPKQQIFSTSSSRHRLTDPDTVSKILADHAAQVCKKARAQNSDIVRLQVFVATSPYDRCPRHHAAVTIELDTPTSDTSIVLKHVRNALPRVLPLCLLTQPLYKTGVGAQQLVNAEMRQFDLFQTSQDNTPLMQALDGLNERFGKGTLGFASQSSLPSSQVATGHVELIELPNYLTNYQQLIKIKCQ